MISEKGGEELGSFCGKKGWGVKGLEHLKFSGRSYSGGSREPPDYAHKTFSIEA